MGERLRSNLHCPYSDCGSSDAVSLYTEDEEQIGGYCFSCRSNIPPKLVAETYGLDYTQEEEILPDVNFDDILSLECRGYRERRIGMPVSEFYGVRTKFDSNDKVSARYYPVTKGEEGELCGFKERQTPKRFETIGKVSAKCQFFGQSLFQPGGKFLIITGGEEDALATYQTFKMNNEKYDMPVVSVTTGEPSLPTQLKYNYDWVSSFEKVVFMLDNDKEGKEAMEKASKMLRPGQAYIADLKLKDPNEYVVRRRESDLLNLFWRARRYSPIELMTLGQMWDDFEKSKDQDIMPLPDEFGELNDMLGGGIAAGEVTLIGALTSIGKSAIINSIVYNTWKNTDLVSGLLYLESAPNEIVRNLLSIHMEKNLSLINPAEYDMGELKKHFVDLVGADDRIIAINHHGAFTNADDLFQRVEWMVKAMGANIVVVDPLQAATPNNDNGTIDEFMDRMLKLGKQTGCRPIIVSHMRKPDTKDPHAVSEYELKGSSSINQIAFNTILLSRDKTHPDDRVRHSTMVQVVKCRRTGNTGPAGWLRWDASRALLLPCDNPYDELLEEAEDNKDTGPVSTIGEGERKDLEEIYG